MEKNDYKNHFKVISNEYRQLRDEHPAMLDAFAGLHKAAMSDGALDKKTKELIALAISVNMRCEGCVVSHARSAVRAEATDKEIAEAVGVSVLLGGGPAQVFGAKALEAAKQFRE